MAWAWILAGFLVFSGNAFAYPELSRHGYTNCNACHLSPSGGGLLTSYGRELSKEILSTWAREGEQYFAYGKISLNEKILLGAYLRTLQAFREDINTKTARIILMQADAEAGYNTEKWAGALTVGRQEIRSGLGSNSRFFSRRHYIFYRPTENMNIRIGKFLRFYGLNDPNHNLYVRKELNFGFDTETYNAEFSFLGENISAYITYLRGSFGKNQYSRLTENAGTASISYFFLDKQKMGASFFLGENTLMERSIIGPWFILQLVPKLFLLSEFNQQFQTIKSTQIKQNGYVTSHRLNYEWIQGLMPFLSYDRRDLNANDFSQAQHAFGGGVQFFPRSHWELVASWQKETLLQSKFQSDLYWLMLHFYL